MNILTVEAEVKQVERSIRLSDFVDSILGRCQAHRWPSAKRIAARIFLEREIRGMLQELSTR